VHGDLHLKNVAVKAGRYQFFDWTDACVTHPFLDMTTIYNEEDMTRQTYLRDMYLTLWTSYAPMKQLLEDWALAGPLCHLHQAISYQHIVVGLEASAQAEFRRLVPHFVRKLLRSLPL
jgi:aminoglycoside phosphotransferase (APT) family kinase protein